MDNFEIRILNCRKYYIICERHQDRDVHYHTFEKRHKIFIIEVKRNVIICTFIY